MIELAKTLGFDNYLVGSAMVLLHKIFKLHSVNDIKHRFTLLAIASLFVAGKVRYHLISLSDAAKAYFYLEMRLDH